MEELAKAPSRQQTATFESLSAKRVEVHGEQLRLKQELVEFGTGELGLSTMPDGSSLWPPHTGVVGGGADRKQTAAEATAAGKDELDAFMDTMKQSAEAANRRKLLVRIVELQKVRSCWVVESLCRDSVFEQLLVHAFVPFFGARS